MGKNCGVKSTEGDFVPRHLATDGILLHGSEANTSNRRRCGLTLRYTAGDVKAYMGWADKGVIVRGDPPPHWNNRPRPGEE